MGRRDTPLPETIGRFRIEAVLGRGGMGEVYKAFDPTLQRTVAVKIVRPDIDRAEYLDRMMREAQACARLSHPNIVTIFEAGQVDGMVYIAMEYLQGENLADVLDQKILGFEQKLSILAKVLEALQHAHGSGVIHRDIKPSNIHLQSDGTIKLMDFGLARVTTAETLTASGNVLGTPYYMSPEQLRGEEIDGRTDVYSAGVMAYEMLAGRRPFEPDNESISSVIIKVIQQPAPPMDTDLSRLLPEIETIVSRAMAKSPAERYQSADEMRRALLNFLEVSRAQLSAVEASAGSTVVVPTPSMISAVSSAASAPAAGPVAASRRWWWAGGAAAAAVLVAVVAYPRPTVVEGAPDVTLDAATSPTSDPAPAAVAPPPPAEARPFPEPGAGGPAASPAARDTSMAAKLEPPVKTAAPAPTAQAMFASASGAIAPGLRFRTILEGPGATPVDVDPARDFHTGDRIRFAFESNIDGYLYVAQRGTSGNWTVLFPNPDINGGRNAVKRFEEYEVPEGNWFQFSGNPGVEQLFVFLSREPMKTLPGFDRPVQSFERGSPALIAELTSSIQSRDLVFAKDAASGGKGMQATYVVNKAELGKAVTASFTLTHKP